MRYYSPYSSRTRPPLWPRFLIGFLAFVIVASGGFAAWLSTDRRAGDSPDATAFVATRVGGTGVAASGTGVPGTYPTPGTPSAAGANAVGANATNAAAQIPPAQNGTVVVTATMLANPRGAAETYVQGWNASDFKTMYSLLTMRAQAAITEEAFQSRYRNIYAESGLTAVKVELVQQEPGTSQFRVRAAFTSNLVGAFTQENVIPLTSEGGQWRVEWTPSLIYNQLNGDGQVHFFADDPIRGRILDRKGRTLAQEGRVKQVGVIGSGVRDENETATRLGTLLRMDRATVLKVFKGQDPSFFIPVRTLPDSTANETVNQLNAVPGVQVRTTTARIYPYMAMASHVIGYVADISPDQLKTFAPKGYRSGDVVGQAGVEFWAEEALAGKRGGRIAVRDPQTMTIRSTIAARDKMDSVDVALTIDVDVQKAAEESLGDRTGSVVMMEPGTGNVLAMASFPRFDPNIFVLGASREQLAALNDEKARPQLNRATQAMYPAGSVFKVVTMTAGFERGGFAGNQPLPCGGVFELKGNMYRDWSTNRRTVTYQEGLVQSCDIVYYTVGQKLDEMDPMILPNMARSFGLGSPTGIQGVPEASGVVPDPQWKRMVKNDGWATGDAINLSIGQGFLLVTPLQMATIYNAIANGGTLWQPRLVARTLNADGSVVRDYPPMEKGKLPIKPENLQVIQAALQQVTTTPSGTAVEAFKGANPPTAGKTGTAEQQGDPHSWFTSYYPAQAPTVAGCVMVEAGGEGSANAAPITRQFYEKYNAIPK